MRALWMVLMLLLGGAVPQAQAELSEAKVEKLVKGLGADSFRTRRDAKKALEAAPRSVIPFLIPYANASDPELKMEVRSIIQTLQSDPNKIPQNSYVLVGGEDDLTVNAFERALEPWRNERTVAAKMDKGRSSTTGQLMAQSFKPETDKITAIEFGSYPVGRGTGWLMLDLRPDHDGAPSDVVLSRCWIYIQAPVNLSGQMLVYDIPDTAVKADGTYWIVFNEFPDDAGPISQVGENSSSSFEGGVSWLSRGRRPQANNTFNFRAVSKSGPVPLLKRADDELLKSRPQPKQDWTARGFQRQGGGSPFQIHQQGILIEQMVPFVR